MQKNLEARLRKLERVETTEGDDQVGADGILHALSVAYGDGKPINPIPAKELRKLIDEAIERVYGPQPESENHSSHKYPDNRRRK